MPCAAISLLIVLFLHYIFLLLHYILRCGLILYCVESSFYIDFLFRYIMKEQPNTLLSSNTIHNIKAKEYKMEQQNNI